MPHVALARRYRPQTFAEVVGQSHITDTLRQAIAGGRVASAYLFTGQRGCGKTTVARIVAKAVNCDALKNGEPCGTCEPCISIAESRSLDVLEIDGASNNSVDDVRELREKVGYAASAPGKRKVYVVDEVHMLSAGAFNALLKTLEEPPPHVLFVLATTEPIKVPDTVKSRCQRFDFRRLLADEIFDRVKSIAKKEKIQIEDGALFLLAKRADGSLRDGLSLLDQVVSSCSGRIESSRVAEILGLVSTEAYFDLTSAVFERDAKRALEVVHAQLRQGANAADLVLGLVEHLRNLLLLAVDPALRTSVQLGDVHLKQAEEMAARFETEDLLFLLNRAAVLYEDTRRSPQPVLGLEAAVVEMTRFESRVVLSELLERLEGGGSTPGGAPPAAGPGRGGPPSGRPGGPASGKRVEPAPGKPPGGPAPGRRSGSTRATAEAGPEAVSDAGAASRLGTTPGPQAFAAGGPLPARASQPAARVASAAIESALVHSAAGESTAVATAALDLDTVSARWSDFTHALRDSKAILAHCLSEGKPVRLAGGTLEVWFPPENSFHLHALQEAIRQRMLEPYLRAFFGRPLKLAVALEAEPQAAQAGRLTPDDIARSRRGAIEDVVQQTPAIDDIIQAFDGEVLDTPDA